MTDIVGRGRERSALDDLLAGARDGRSGVIVLAGEAGIGKTVLLEHVRHAATETGFRVESSIGSASETQFAYAGLHQLCGPMLDQIGALADPQQAALGVALGLRAGAPPEGFLVGLATLNLLAEVAEKEPLLCLVDDAQWLDEASAQVLAFVARRLAAEQIALVFARRDADEHGVDPFAIVPELRVNGLADPDARALLDAAVHGPMDGLVRDRIVAEAGGNPLALLELPRSVQLAQLAGGFELPDVTSVPRRVEDGFLLRSTNLPADTQMLLLVAAADPTGDTELLWRAAAHLKIDRDVTAAAEAAGLLEIDTFVRFRHPLVRSAVYQAATPSDKRRAHGALAAATEPPSDLDRRVWHRAQAVRGTDEEVAADLERSAGRARSRGGIAAAAAFLEHAARLTPEPADRARRALEAAHAKHDAGAPDAAVTLLEIAAAGPLDRLQNARLELLRSRIAFHTTRGSDVPAMLVDAARRLTPLDAVLARKAYAQALEASFHAGRLARRRDALEVAEAARDAPPPPTPPQPVDLLLDGLTTRFIHGYVASAPTLQRALEMLRRDATRADDDSGRWLWLACHVAATLWDDETIYVLANRAVRIARETGALTTLPTALNALASVLVLTGELSRAAELLAEEEAITQLTGTPPLPNARLTLASWRGRELETLELSATLLHDATERGEGATVGMTEVSLAYLHNGLGNYEAALAAASPPCEHDELAYSSVALPELVEAAVHAGQPERAAVAAEKLSLQANASSTEWALGLAARSRALTSTGPSAEEHYREAIERLGSCRMAAHLARAHLVYGEWLRRERRRQDARQQLRTAHELLSDMGADAFAARAARELRATGEHPRVRSASPTDELTAHELNIARLVATGATNREVGAQLFLSPRTIEAHLRSIFRKLDITSRRQLKDVQLP